MTKDEFECYDSMFERSGGELFSRGAVASAATSVESHAKVDQIPKGKVDDADIAVLYES